VNLFNLEILRCRGEWPKWGALAAPDSHQPAGTDSTRSSAPRSASSRDRSPRWGSSA